MKWGEQWRGQRSNFSYGMLDRVEDGNKFLVYPISLPWHTRWKWFHISGLLGMYFHQCDLYVFSLNEGNESVFGGDSMQLWRIFKCVFLFSNGLIGSRAMAKAVYKIFVFSFQSCRHSLLARYTEYSLELLSHSTHIPVQQSLACIWQFCVCRQGTQHWYGAGSGWNQEQTLAVQSGSIITKHWF